MRMAVLGGFVFALVSCSQDRGTEAPPEGWANNAPTVVERVVERAEAQLLQVKQGRFRTWVQVPKVGAEVGDYVLLGQGEARTNVHVPEMDTTVPELVDIRHARPVDLETARRAVVASIPKGALSVGQVFAELGERAEEEVVVYGTVSRVAGAIGWYWVHLRDSTGDPSASGYDLTIQTKESAPEGRRVAYRGRLRKDVDLGFGYHYDALLEEAVFVE